MAKKKEKLSLEELLDQAIVKEEDRPYEVPGNWVWTRLKHIIKPMVSKKPNQQQETFRYIDIDAIDNKNQCIYNPKIIPIIEAPSRASREVCEGDTLFSLVRPYLRNIAYVNKEHRDCIASTGFYVCKPTLAVNSKYLFYILCSEYIINTVNQYMKGDNSPSVRSTEFESCFIPIPPIAEQNRIVKVIESLFEKLDKAKELIQNALESFESRKAAILHKAFTGELTSKWREENGVSLGSWKIKKISEICNVVRGGSPRPAGDPKYYDGDIPFLKVADITKNQGAYLYTYENSIKEAGLNRTRMVDANTLLLTNSGATLGVPAICTFQTTFNDGIAAFLNLNIESLKFFYYFWITQTQALRAINKGAAQPNLNTDIIGNIEVKLPLIEEQKEIVRILDNLLEKEQRAKELFDTIEKIDLMKKAILAKAFRGELGTNDPKEENAVELLKEVLKEKI